MSADQRWRTGRGGAGTGKPITRTVGSALAVFVAISLQLAVAPSATADVIYMYTGSPFTFASAPFTQADRVTMSITLATPLAPNTALTDLLSSPDLVTYQVAVASLVVIGPTNTSGGSVLELSTDGSGEVASWAVGMFSTDPAPDGPANIFSCSFSAASNVCAGDLEDSGFDGDTGGGGVLNNPGSWSVVPEPSTLSLLAPGLLGLAVRRKRRGSG